MTIIAYTEPLGWSKLDTYRACPAQFKYQYVDKIKTPTNAAMARGSVIHDQLEQYLNGWGTAWPKDIQPKWQSFANALRDTHDVRTEAAWGVDRSWKLLPNWLHPKTWLRAKGDWFYKDGKLLVMGDWKTGKYRVPSDDQIELYAVIGVSVMPDVTEVHTSFCFVDQPEQPLVLKYSAKELTKLRGKFVQEFLKIEKERKWAPKPSSKCRWCPFSRQKNGPCQY
jgi:hypothetical protein